MAAAYCIPPGVRLSSACQDLLSAIFVAQPSRRITMERIQQHAWFKIDLPAELMGVRRGRS